MFSVSVSLRSLFPSLFLLLLTIIVSAAAAEYLKLPLVHKTPHTSPLQTRLSLLNGRRHHHHGQTLKSPVISGASSGSGQYFISLHLGSPPQPLVLVADTGSDLIWLSCSACKNCSLRSPGSAFLARHSTSFSPHHCFQSTCRLLVPHPSPNPCNHTHLHSPCRYEYEYADGSVTAGFFSKEIITLNTSSGQQVELKDFHFGCGFKNTGPSITGSSFNGAHGVMGLGRGPISFSSQLGRRFGNKFSYCLMDYTLSPPPTSFLIIGGEANHDVRMNPKMSFTALLTNPVSPTFYYIAIKSVYVDDVKLRIDPLVWSIDELGNGGTVIDSGTTLTFLAEPAYRKILAAFKRRVKLPSPAESILGFDLCVNVSGVSRASFPKLSFELVGNSVFSPPQSNYFIETSERVKCLAIQPVNTGSGFSVIGNLMQQGFLFEFDRDKSRLGFSRNGCALP
ncbi:Aspartyl protease family protein 2 [Melia azedarach]|uniref:Aspartyl protease family protein 2 n=1 Tax=Melia azedarach TaxID=155640 RepID=A0ACC1XI07_MELAZ|nr:Aspartyl protease family protein 2 [Melia azedarach]